MIVVCHFCQDNSPELAHALVQEGLPLDVHEISGPIFEESRVKTDVFEQAARTYDPEWILPLDADEFLVCSQGLDTDAALAELRRDLPTRLLCKAYVPTAADEKEQPNVLLRIPNRSPVLFGSKVIVPRELRRRRRLGVSQGHSHVYELQTGRAIAHMETKALALAHFPARSAGQFQAKVLGSWPCFRAALEFAAGSAHRWQQAYEELASSMPLSRERFLEIAHGYNVPNGDELVFDPLEVEFELCYQVAALPPHVVLARTAEGLAEASHAFGCELERSARRRLKLLLDRLGRIPAKVASAVHPLHAPDAPDA